MVKESKKTETVASALKPSKKEDRLIKGTVLPTSKELEEPTVKKLGTLEEENGDDNVILSVRHLKQFFRFGTGIYKYTKAVHDVSFDIHRGEVLGLVGESGCGKTTTGRSIIKLYDITSGSVYFEGVRIGAGTRWNEKEIKFKTKKAHSQIAALNEKRKEAKLGLDASAPDYKEKEAEIDARYGTQIAKIRSDLSELVHLQRREIALARHDNERCNKDYAKQKVAELNVRYRCYFNAIKDKKGLNESSLPVLTSVLERYVKQKLSFSNSYEKESAAVAKKKDGLLATAKSYLSKPTHEGQEKFAFVEQFLAFVGVVNSLVDYSAFDKVDLTLSKRIDNNYAGLIKALPLDEEATSLPDLPTFFRNYVVERRVASHEKITSRMQMIFQDPIASLDPRMTVKEIIAEGLRIRGVKDKAYIDDKVNSVLKEVGLLPEHASRYPHEFSGGQRQRIGIARALVMDPDLIIADEPISALDVSIQAQVINLLDDLKEKRHLSILFIAHDLSVVKYFCDRIAVMYFGDLVELASSDALFKNPLHPYTKSLLSAIPLPDPHYEKTRKRIDYIPSRDHDYSSDKPSLQEVAPGHFARVNAAELKKCQEILGITDDGDNSKAG
jgi:oligopeptide transport system ATP-binding protein